MKYKLVEDMVKERQECDIYIRVSSERQVQGFSLDAQKRELMNYAETRGLKVHNVYVEPGKSGKDIDGREQFQKMLYDVTRPDSKVRYILVFKLSRFGRNARDILNTLNIIQQYGVDLISKEDGLDSSSQAGKLLIPFLGVMAEMERDNISTQTMSGRIEKAKQGGWGGGFAPFGYDNINGQLVVNEDAYIVKMIYDKYINENIGMKTIADYLNRNGIKKRKAKNRQNYRFEDWTDHAIKYILDNEVYTGYVCFGRRRTVQCINQETGKLEYKLLKQKEYIVSDEQSHEALVSKEMWDKAQQLRKNRGVKGNKNIGQTPKHLLSGILKCPDCGSNMVINYNKWCNQDGSHKVTRTYICGHYNRAGAHGECKRNGVAADRIEKEVVNYTKNLVAKPEFAEYVKQKIGKSLDLSELEKELSSYDKKIKVLERNKDSLFKDIDNLLDDDKIANRKRIDMNKRLDKIYEELERVEEERKVCLEKIGAVRQQELNEKRIYQLLLDFNKIYDKLSDIDMQKLLQSLVSEIQVYKKEEIKVSKTYIKKIRYAFDVDNFSANLGNKNGYIETVCLLGNRNAKPDSYVDLSINIEDYHRIKNEE